VDTETSQLGARDTKTLGRGGDIMNTDDAEVSSCAVKLYKDS
jgi:hypothetical protein